MNDIQERIINALHERGVKKPCERCGGKDFTILEDFARIDQQSRFDKLVVGGNHVPCASIICKNCGNINLHALGALGLLDEVRGNEREKIVDKQKGANNG